jgi:hypothetical protein
MIHRRQIGAQSPYLAFQNEKLPGYLAALTLQA